ncbi:hypothetical protein B296_00006355 [Ensete ventricosum]|uniref:Uncharacterized protein n=1 Tax=Ensete ventricosum TaxID=4639 RepID=A0A427AJS8_ENSVE|nr:hypothetical protein B296_00006355 [Ensete ventricosum]
MRQLCSARAGVDGQDYHAIRMCNLPEQTSDAPLDPDLRPLTHGTPIWQSGEASAIYIRGMLLPRLASDLYTLPSKVLMDGAAKAMVLVSAFTVSSHVFPPIEYMTQDELDEANGRRASVEADLEKALSESASLERQLADLRKRLGDSEGQPRSTRAQVRQMETELLDLARSKEALREDLPKRAVKKYKESPGFEMGLVRMGRLSLEYRYQLALARLQAWHLGVEIELDPFATLPEDADVPIADVALRRFPVATRRMSFGCYLFFGLSGVPLSSSFCMSDPERHLYFPFINAKRSFY